MSDTIIALQPKQKQLWNLIDDHSEDAFNWIGYGGSRGGSKSNGIRQISVRLMLKYPGIRILIFRKISENLRKNHIVPFKREFPEIMEYYNQSKNHVELPNGSMVVFGYAANIDDIGKFQGDEYDIIFIDEATHITQKMIEELKTCNRSPLLRGFREKMVLTMNPGNVGHKFIKRIFIDREYTDTELQYNRYIYLPARVQDNVIWSIKALYEQGKTVEDYYYKWNDDERFEFTLRYSSYAQALASLPEVKKRAYLYGDWDNFEGQFFDKLVRDIHFIDPFDIPEDWYRNGSMDYGNTSVSHHLRVNHNQDMFCTNEWTFLKGHTMEKAKDYYDWNLQHDLTNKNFKVFCDTNMKDIHNEHEEKISPLDKFKAYFRVRDPECSIRFDTVTKSSPDKRRPRIYMNDEVLSRLDWKKDKYGMWIYKPKLYIFKTCPKLFSTMSELQVDEDDIEDIDQSQDNDHHYDSLKYNVVTCKLNSSYIADRDRTANIEAELRYKQQFMN